MMKKILVALLALCLFGCSLKEETKMPSLSDLGYSQEDIDVIETYPEEIQAVFASEYNQKYVDLMHTDDFDINKLNDYVLYYGSFDNNKLIELVNGGVINNDNVETYKSLYNNEYYLTKNESLYLEYLDQYDNTRDCIEAVNTKTYLPYYTNVETTDLSKNYCMLVNKYNALPSDYQPDDLVEIAYEHNASSSTKYIREEVYDAYCKMFEDASALGYDFCICSAFRSYDYQDGLYSKYLNEDAGGQASVDTYSARPGHSEHQTGLCLDLYDPQYGMDDFGLSKDSKWVNENCYKYGFIIRYTQEKEKITGYQAEPWQVRYVGSPEIAKDIMDRGITFDEYYACFIEE